MTYFHVPNSQTPLSVLVEEFCGPGCFFRFAQLLFILCRVAFPYNENPIKGSSITGLIFLAGV